MRSLFLNELCNFSTNSWAEDQRDTNELGFCAGRVVWVDPSSIMLGCSSVTRAIVPDGDAVAVRGLDRLSWAWFVAGFIPTSRLFSIDDGEYPHKRASRIGFGSGLPGRYPARARRGEPSPSGDDDPDRFAVQLRRERDAARRSVRAAVHELDLPDRCAQQQGRAGKPQAPAGTDGERAADPPARRQPDSSHGDDAAAGRARVRGLAGRGDAQRTRGAVLAHEGNVGR